MQLERSHRPKHGLILTSIIDVVVLLVVFFMLTSRFMIEQSMEVTLTSTGPAGDATSLDTLVITPYPNNKITMQGVEYTDRNEFSKALALALRKAPEKGIVVRTSGGVSVQEVVSLLDEIHANGGQYASLAE